MKEATHNWMSSEQSPTEKFIFDFWISFTKYPHAVHAFRDISHFQLNVNIRGIGAVRRVE
jgi:hypothetical protein